MFPGGGQFYNEQNIKGSILLSGAVLSSLVHLDFANKYKNHDGENFSQKEEYLKQRNRYGWWVLIIYFYGLVDALVESHLRMPIFISNINRFCKAKWFSFPENIDAWVH